MSHISALWTVVITALFSLKLCYTKVPVRVGSVLVELDVSQMTSSVWKNPTDARRRQISGLFPPAINTQRIKTMHITL